MGEERAAMVDGYDAAQLMAELRRAEKRQCERADQAEALLEHEKKMSADLAKGHAAASARYDAEVRRYEAAMNWFCDNFGDDVWRCFEESQEFKDAEAGIS